MDIRQIKSKHWQLSLDTPGEVVQGIIPDINQCILIICGTILGTDPVRPLFGINLWPHIDKPVMVAIPDIIQEIVTAVGMWEKRISVTNVTWSLNESHVTFQIQWTLVDGSLSDTALVEMNRSLFG